MKFNILSGIIFFVTSTVCFFPAIGQLDMLSHKTIAVYFSKRQFGFDEEFNTALTQLLLKKNGDDYIVRDLKLETLILMGERTTQGLPTLTHADSSWFLNGNPEAAKIFMNAFNADSQNLKPLDGPFEGTDYVLVISGVNLGHYKTSSVYVKSNRILTESIQHSTGRVNVQLFHAKNGMLVFSGESCLDEKNIDNREAGIDLFCDTSPAGKFLSALITGGLSPICGKQVFSCPEPKKTQDN